MLCCDAVGEALGLVVGLHHGSEVCCSLPVRFIAFSDSTRRRKSDEEALEVSFNLLYASELDGLYL
jgi:hypothetical protein